jgi:hypothetical protein
MERFDPSIARQHLAPPTPAWEPNQTSDRANGFGERAIGELVRAIVARLDDGRSAFPANG